MKAPSENITRTIPRQGKPWTTDEAETYLRAAVSACNELMTSKKYSLVSDPANVSTQYRKLFTSESVFTQEVIWARVYNAELNATHNLNSNFIVQQYGSYSLTKQFINTYLNLDGSRFTDKPGYEKDRIHRRVRESRLPPDANRPLPRLHSQEQRNGYPLCPPISATA